MTRSVALSHMCILRENPIMGSWEIKHLSASNCLRSVMCFRQNFILLTIIRCLTFFVNIAKYLYDIVNSD